MRLLAFLCSLCLLLPAAAFADEDETPPWEEPEEEEDEDEDEAEEADDDDDDDDEEEEETYSAAPVATSFSGYRSGSPVGLGFTAGTLNGFSLKIWPDQAHGIVFNVGVPNLLNSLGLNVGYRFHMPKITVPGTPAHWHLYVGGAFRARMVFFNNGTYVEIGGGAAIGGSLTFSGAPVEIWAEVIPSGVGGISPPGVGVGFDVDGLVGIRFFPG